MSFFSDINGFNAKDIKSIYSQKDDAKADFSEVDFCINEDMSSDIFVSDNDYGEYTHDSGNIFDFSAENIQETIEDLMYNYNMTPEEAEEYIHRNMNLEG